jgi:hypothetical protein
MITRKISRFWPSWRIAVLVAVSTLASGLLAGCTLGATGQTPGPAATTSLVLPGATTPGQVVQPQQIATATVPVAIPTAGATAAPLPSEVFGPVTITSTTLRTAEPLTIVLTRGKAVGTVTCLWVLQGTTRQATLSTPVTATKDENTITDTFTFTPDAAGTYQINCNGIVTTASGQRAVNVSSQPFTVEAKG